jgi:hypothetical protein
MWWNRPKNGGYTSPVCTCGAVPVICAVGWMDLMIILQLLLCLTRCEPR